MDCSFDALFSQEVSLEDLEWQYLKENQALNCCPHCVMVLSPLNIAVIDTDMLWSTSRGLLFADSCCFVCLEND